MVDPAAVMVIESKKKHKQTTKKLNVDLDSSQGMSAVQLAQKMVTQLTT
jgi:hypothetical protein